MREVSDEKKRAVHGGGGDVHIDDLGNNDMGGAPGEGDGYHSDSDSTVMMSGNSPFVSKSARYNFLQRSGEEIKANICTMRYVC